MAFVDIGPVWSPLPFPFNGSNAAFSSTRIDASGEKIAYIVQVPKTGTLDKFEFCLGTVTQAPSAGIRCSFQDIAGANGDPDGTQDQYRDVTTGLTSNTWVAPGLMTSNGTDGGGKRSVTKGDIIACVIEFVSFNASDNLDVRSQQPVSLNAVVRNRTYVDHYTTSWSKTSIAVPAIALKYNDGSYGLSHFAPPADALSSTSATSASNPDEFGLYFSFAGPVKITGVAVNITITANSLVDVVLYDTDGTTALETVTIDTEHQASAGGWWYVHFATARALTASGNYRVAIKPDTNTCTLFWFTVNSAAIMDACHGGQGWHWTQRVDAGAWSQTTTKRPWICLCVSAIDDGAGGSGGGGPLVGGRLVR